MILLPGCTSSDVGDTSDDSENVVNSELSGVNIVAETLGRDVDGPSIYNLLEQSGNNSTLILWAAAGCHGCHEWTSMIRESIENGTIPGEVNVVTVHRYPNFEKRSYVNDTYGNLSSDYYSPWPILLPEEDAFAWDANTGKMSSTGLVNAFNNPVTPTLQILDSKGELIWQSKTYYAEFAVIDEILEVIR